MRCTKKPDWEFDTIVANLPWMTCDGWGPRGILTHFCEVMRPKAIYLFVPVSMVGPLTIPRVHPGYRLDKVIMISKAKSKSFNPGTGKTYTEAWESAWMAFLPGDGPDLITYVE